MAASEKLMDNVKVHLGESLKRDLQDLAMADDRKVSDYIRMVLEYHVYGAQRRIQCREGTGADWAEEGRFGSNRGE